jgi:hypothetical protein
MSLPLFIYMEILIKDYGLFVSKGFYWIQACCSIGRI